MQNSPCILWCKQYHIFIDAEEYHEVYDIEQSHGFTYVEHYHVFSEIEQSYSITDVEESHVVSEVDQSIQFLLYNIRMKSLL